MKIKEYLEKINQESQSIFHQTVADDQSFGKAHHLSTCIFEFSSNLQDINEKEMLKSVCSQLESGSLNTAYGLYRQAFASLRLAFEMALGAVYFSINKLEHYEWLKGKGDIKWAKLIDDDSGVLSKRFCQAFFTELIDDASNFSEKAKVAYRELSEYVHGNSQTWLDSGLVLKYNNHLKEQYFAQFKIVSEIILFVLSCRYLKTISTDKYEALDLVFNELNHIGPIRELFGGPKEI